MADDTVQVCSQCGSDDGVAVVPCVGILCYVCKRNLIGTQVGTLLGYPVVLVEQEEEWADTIEG